MGYSVSQSLVSGQPPLLVFTICLMAFGLTMVVLAYVIGERDVPNPDVGMDWNKFFTEISSFKLCEPTSRNIDPSKGNVIDTHRRSNSTLNATTASSSLVDESRSLSAVLSQVVGSGTEIDDESLVEISVKVTFEIRGRFDRDSQHHWKGQLKGKQLGFTGKYSSYVFNISLAFQTAHNASCLSDGCQDLRDVCLTLSLPSTLLPETKSPERCEMGNVQEVLAVYFIENYQKLNNVDSSIECLGLQYSPDAKLTEMLSLQDRSIVNLHLMHTSYFMFVMVMTLICYSLVKGKYHRHSKASLSLEKIPLDA